MIEVRLYQPADALPLLALFRDTIRRVNCRDYSPEQVAAWASDEIDPDEWAERFTGRHVLVAETAGVIAGFAELEPSGHLDRVFVSADHQRQGIGHLLLSELIAAAHRQRIPRLFVEASITAKEFFEAHGFVVITPQVVTARGVEFVNFRMERAIG